MSFDIPTLPALVSRAQQDLARVGVDGALRRSDVAVLSRVMAGGAFGLYGYQAWIARQILPDTCDDDMLQRWADLKGVTRTSATRSEGEITVTGTGTTMVPAGYLWQTQDGRRVVVATDTLVSAGMVPVRAEGLGQVGNMSIGTKLSAVSPIDGLASDAVVSTDLAGGTDLEPVDRWRRRVVRSFRIQPHGGDLDDYVTWALAVPGVTRAWARRAWMGLGTVGVFFVRDDDDPITPDATEIQAVSDYLETRKPVQGDVYVIAPQLLSVDFSIRLTPDTAAVRARVELALRALLMDEADLGVRLYRTHVSQAISNTTGEIDHGLVSPAADVVPANNELPVFGVITWL